MANWENTRDTEGNGEWSAVQPLTIIPLHAIVLPDGKVLSFGSTEEGMQGGQFVFSLFDPETGVEKVLPNTTGTNVFCSNMTLDPATGNVLITGGDGNGNGGGVISGIDAVTVFDYRTETIQESSFGTMEYARWYPTNLTLPNGETLILGGRDQNYNGSTTPEVFNPDTGFRQLTNADMPDLGMENPANRLDESWWYPHAWVNSEGDVIVIEAKGDDIYRMTTDGSGTVEKIGQTGLESYRLNSSIMYDVDKIAIMGDDGGVYTADISDPAPTFTLVSTLENARTNAGMIPMPDGTVLIVGGAVPIGANGADQGNDLDTAVYNPTIWNPETNELTQLEDQALARLYHSSALLLPDGTIWSGGGGAPGPLTNTNVEIFAPPSLYDSEGNLADRPAILDAPTNIAASQTFRITVDDATDIDIISAIKSGAMTHGRNSDARFVELDFVVINGTTIEITTPDANIMVPGLWMLFAVDEAGVPSESSMLGINMAQVVDTAPLEQTDLVYFNIDDDQIDGAFQAVVEVRFDDLGAGDWQRVFDFGNGTAADNIWLGQVAGSDDMAFEVWQGGVAYRIIAPDAIVEGEIASWRVSVDVTGAMQLWKNDVLLADGQGAVPADVERSLNFVGDSNWLADTRLVGLVRNLEIVNEGDTRETDGKFPTKPMNPEVTPDDLSFFAEAEVRFDDIDGGAWQRVFDYGDGPYANNIWLGQVWNTDDMRFELIADGVTYNVTAADAIVEGETAEWTARITDTGMMQIFKNGTLLAEAQGVAAPDLDRANKLVGESNWAADTPLIGEVVSITVDENGAGSEVPEPTPEPEPTPTPTPEPEPTPTPSPTPDDLSFFAEAEVRFDNLDGGAWQRVFDYGDGPYANNIWLGQVWNTDDMRFELIADGVTYNVTAADAIVEGETADWTARITDTGMMQIFKNGTLLAEAQGVAAPDLDRANKLVGESNWAADTPLIGEVFSITVDENGAGSEVPEPTPEPEPKPEPEPEPTPTPDDLSFFAEAEVRFDDLDGGEWQRVFDYGDGPDTNNVWLGQFWNTDDMRFEVLNDGVKYAITAQDSIVEGEVAVWTSQVDDTGLMQIFKDGVLLVEGQGIAVPDVDRANKSIGESNWAGDTPLIGQVLTINIDEDGSDPSASTPDAFTFGSSTYQLGTSGLTWEQANAEAIAKGGRLVEINSAEEDAFVFETFGGDENPIWLGFNDIQTEGSFVDSTGADLAYTNFLPGEPNNYSGNQDYVAMASSNGQWDDTGVDGGYFYDGGWSGGFANVTVIEFI